MDSYPIPNLINGVSQQAPSQRRDTQAEAQVNCINSPVDGAVARPGTNLIRFIPGLDVTGGYYFFLMRSTLEKHVVVVRNNSIRAWDLLTGNESIISTPNGTSYLAAPADAADTFSHVTVEDFTFIANRSIVPAINTAVRSPVRPKEALAFFRAGNYKETYKTVITYLGSTWEYSFQTPNNATAGNEEFIKTNFLANAMATLFQGGLPANVTVVSNGGGTNLSLLGFNVTLSGSSIILSHPTNDFTITAGDGSADAAYRVVKDQAQKFSDLPANAFPGFTIKVAGQEAAKEDDYWVTFKMGGAGNSSGIWEETLAPDTPTGMDDATMPWALVSLGGNAFRFERQVWAKRVTGDGITSSRNPEFIGKGIVDLFWNRGRFGILTEGSVSWSAARQPYTYFPSTAQTRLVSDPIGYRVAHTKVATLKSAVAYNEQLLLWADGTQFVVNSGEILEESTIEINASTEFSFNPRCRPVGSGSNVYFVSQNGAYSALWEYFVTAQGTSKSANEASSQVPAYIPGSVIRLTGSTSLKMVMALASSERNRLYCYNYFITGEEKLQSSWSYWSFDADTQILAMEFDNNNLFILADRPNGTSLEVMNCQPIQNDPGLKFTVRLDRRITEAGITALSYNAGTDRTTITVPNVTPASTMVVVARAGTTTVPPITEFPVVSSDVVTGQMVVEGDLTGIPLYIGTRIPDGARYKFSQFFPKDGNGVFIPAERTQLKYLTVVHSGTGYYKVIVTLGGSKQYVSEFTGRILGENTNVSDGVALEDGEFRRPVKGNARRVSIELVNDSFLPSAWQSAEYHYIQTTRARRVK